MKHLIKTTALLTGSNVVARFTVMCFYVILARAMLVSDYGLFRYLITLSVVFSVAFTGFPIALTKFIGEDKSNKKNIAEYLTNSSIMMLIVFSVMIIITISSQASKLYLGLLLFGLLVENFYLGFIRGLLNYVKLAGFQLVENLIQLVILVVSFILLKQINFSYAVIFFSISPFLSLIIFEIMKPELKFCFYASEEKIKKITKYAILVTLGSVGWTIMFSINTIFLKYFYNTEQVGYYSVGVTIAQVFTFLPMAIYTIMLPKVAGLKDKSQLQKPLTLAVLGSLFISILGLIFLLMLMKPIIMIIFGERYIPTLAVILPLSLGQISISLHQIYSSVWQGLGKPIIPTINISVAAILNVILSYFLTRSYGILGASISNAITSFIALISTVIIFYSKWKTLSKD